MNSSDKRQRHDPRLHAAAEGHLTDAPIGAPKRTEERLVHELQLHKIELELQNEALRRSQMVLEDSRDHYANVFEFAPVVTTQDHRRQESS